VTLGQDNRFLYLMMAVNRTSKTLKSIDYRLQNVTKDYDKSLVDVADELRDLADTIVRMVNTASELDP
jgi:hypothetical protein